jgi:hypothetical protein
MIRVPNRHAATFDPVQQSKQWEDRIRAEEKLLGLTKPAEPVVGGASAEALAKTIIPLVSEKKPVHFHNHRGIDRPPTASSRKSGKTSGGQTAHFFFTLLGRRFMGM